MSNYSIVPNAALTATADAIRTKSGAQSTIEFDHNTGFKDAVDAIPSGGDSGGWLRPSAWPDYSQYTLSGTEIFLTADTSVPFPFFRIKVVGTGTLSISHGTLSGSTFTPVDTQTLTSNTATIISLEANTGYHVYRVTTTGTITQFLFEGGNITSDGKTFSGSGQCIVEAYGRLPDATKVMFRGMNLLASVTLLNMAALADLERGFNECRLLANVKITGMTAWTNGYYTFATCENLSFLDLDGYDMKTLTSATSIFNNCRCNILLNAKLDFSGFTTGFGTYAFENYKGEQCPNNVYISGTSMQNFIRTSGIKKIIKPTWNTGSIQTFSYALYNNNSLIEVDLSTINMSQATSTSNMLQNCVVLQKVTFPSTLNRVDASMLGGCTSLNEVHFLSTSVPPMANTNAFSSVPSTCKIYVPYSADHSILEAYQTATNWSTYASQMQEEPQP